FFFSSRSRHTRFSRDWSSDVCSSDLGSLFLILINLVLGYGKDFMPFNTNWFVVAILIWLFILIYHTFNVFVTHRFMGKAWEQHQLNALVAKQKQRIEQLKQKVEKDTIPKKTEEIGR